jgi:hypothetical protein
LARIILSHALLESIRFVMSRKERRDIYGLINMPEWGVCPLKAKPKHARTTGCPRCERGGTRHSS